MKTEGDFKVLCFIKSFQTENMFKRFCRTCKKLNNLDFSSLGTELICDCGKVI